jgi:hypothetical protein
MEPTFKVGDRVTFKSAPEVFPDGDEYPIWSFDRQTDDMDLSQATWHTGTVIDICNNTVNVEDDVTGLGWFWPLKGNLHYSPDQWQRDGYLALASTHCELYALLRQGCTCGVMAAERAAKPKRKYNMKNYL